MNRNYKVIWNRSLGCFTAVAEYAKSRGKSSSGAVTSGASSTSASSAVSAGAKLWRLSTLSVGLAVASMTMSPQVMAAGTFTNTAGNTGIAISGTGNVNVACGPASATDPRATAIGCDTVANYQDNIAIGNNATATGTIVGASIAIGASAAAAGDRGTALGVNSNATGENSTAVGANTQAIASTTSAFGQNAKAGSTTGGASATAIGANTQAVGTESAALGSRASASASGNASTAVGARSIASATQSSAFGFNSNAGGSISTAVGARSIASAAQSSAFGFNSNASGTQSSALGTAAKSESARSLAVGTNSKANGISSSAIGANAQTSAAGALALGSGANSDKQNAVALGTNSTTATNTTNEQTVVIGGQTFTFAGQAAANSGAQVSVGAAGTERQLKNVASGNISTASTDAINGSQLAATNEAVEDNFNTGAGNIAAIGGGAAYDPATNTYTAPTFNVNGVANNNVGAAITALDAGFNLNSNGNNVGAIKAGDTVDIGTATGETNIQVTKTANVVDFNLNPVLTGLTSVAANTFTAGDSVLTTNGLTITGGPSITKAGGVNAGNKAITNVASGGTTTNNAANIGDLNTAIAANKVKYFSVKSTGGTNENNNGATGADAIAIGKNAVADKTQSIALGLNANATGARGLAIGRNSTASALQSSAFGNLAEAIGTESVAVGSRSQASALNALAIGPISRATGSESVAIGSQSNASGEGAVSIGTGTISDKQNSVALGTNSKTDGAVTSETTNTLGGQTFAVAGNVLDGSNVIAQGQQVAVGQVGLERQIKNLAGGAINATSTDAVNGSQLNATNTVVEDNFNTGAGNIAAIGGGAAYDPATNTYTAPTFNVVTDPSGAEAPVRNVGDAITALNTAVQTPLTFAGDTGIDVTRQLGTTLDIKGGATTPLTTGNIGVVANGTNGLDIQLAETIDLGANGSVTTGNTQINNAGFSFVDGTGPSITTAGFNAGNTVISNVAPGEVSATSTDAINGSQLNAAAAGARTEVEAGTNVNNVVKTTGANGQDIYTVNASGTTSTAGSDAITVTDNTVGNITNSVIDLSQGTKDSLTAADSALQTVITQIDGTEVKTVTKADNTANFVSGTNIALSDDGNGGIVVATKDDLISNSVTANTFNAGKTTVNDDGLIIGDGENGPIFTATAIDVAGNQITSVASGLNGGNIVDAEGDTLTNAANIGDLQGAVTGVTELGFNISADNGTDDNVQLGETVDFTNTDGNLVATVSDNGINYDLAPNITVDSVTAGNTLINDAGFSFVNGAGPSITTAGFNAGNTVITNVAPGEVSATSTDAINGSQLNAAAAGARTEVEAGTNVNNVVKTTGANGQDIYTVNASGTTSTAGSDAITVTDNTVGNITNSVIDLSTATKASLVKADNSVQYDNDDKTSVTLGGLGATAPVSLTNVAAGEISATSTDAVNGSQLNTTNNNVTKNTTDIAGNTTNITKNAGDIANNTTNITKNTSDITALNQGFNLETNGADTGAVKAGDTVDIGTATGETNILVSKTGNTVDFSLADDITVTSVTAGDSLLNNNGLTITGGPSVTKEGINAGGNKITNVANGAIVAGSTDAINGGQLNDLRDILVGPNSFNITAQGDNSSNVGPGESVDFNSADGNITVSKTPDSNDVSFELNRDLDLDSATFGDVNISANGLNNGGNKITNVANGTVAAGSKDAVNGGQLNTTNNNVTNNTNAISNNTSNINKGINFGNGTTANNYALGSTISVTGDKNVTTTTVDGGVQVALNKDIDLGATGSVTTGNTTVNNAGVTIANGPSLTAGGINAGGKVVTGVADGIEVNDAVNVGQLNNFGNQINGAINDLGYKIDDVADEANAGISAAMAMSSIPQSFLPGRSLIGGGISTYNGEGAVAVGLSRVSDNGRWVMKINGTADTKGNAGGAIGAGFHF